MILTHGADATIVNSDGELAYDIAEGDRTKGILNDEMARLGALCGLLLCLLWCLLDQIFKCALYFHFHLLALLVVD